MANLGIELLILTVLLIYFGLFMAQNFYKKGIRLSSQKHFCVESQSNPY